MATLLSFPNESLIQTIEESATNGNESLVFGSKLAKPVLKQYKKDLKKHSTLHLNNEVFTLYDHMKADEMDELKLNPIDFLQALLERPRLAQYRKRWCFQAGLFNELDGIEYVLTKSCWASVRFGFTRGWGQ